MENLIIEHKGQSLSRKIIGFIWILIAIILLITNKEPLQQNDWIRSIAFFIIGIIFFTPLVGSSRSTIGTSEGFLKIKWMDRTRTITIHEDEIERILLAKDGVKIFLKGKKPVKILLYLMGKEEKDQVYKFFTEYAQQNNFTLGK